MTVKISTLAPEQKVHAGYRSWTTPCTFKGFGIEYPGAWCPDNYVSWAKLSNAHMAAGCSKLTDLEAWATAQGKTVYAVFEDAEDGSWAAYLWKGCFRVGSSADRLQLSETPLSRRAA